MSSADKIKSLLSLSLRTKAELRRTGQGARSLARLPAVALDRTFAVPQQLRH